MSKKPSPDWPTSKEEIGPSCIDQPRNAAELRQWIAERYVTLEMTGMGLASLGLHRTDGRTVHQAWDWAEWLELRGYPPRPEDPSNGWTPHTERIALEKLREWLDEYLKPKDAGDSIPQGTIELLELADGQLWIKDKPFRLTPREWAVLEAIAKYGALTKAQLGKHSNLADDAVKVLGSSAEFVGEFDGCW